MRSRRRAQISIGRLLVLLLSACSPPSRPGNVRVAAGEYGGRFVFPLRTEPATLNFVTASDQPADLVSRLVGDSLIDRDAAMNIVPRLAESWDWSDGGRILTFHLRPGVTFHDGRPLTSADVKYTYERVIDPKSHALARLDGFLPILRVDTPDERTARVVYRHPYAPALSSWEVAILP